MVLHCWDHRTARVDFSYRYDSTHAHFDVSIPTLNGARVTVRYYKCNEVNFCVEVDLSMEMERHFHAAPTEESMLCSITW